MGQLTSNSHLQYAARYSPLGPQMTYSAHAIGEAELQESGCAAYTYMLQASEPYIRQPFYQFSELMTDDASLNGGTEPAFPFLTGHGGWLQIFTHGLTGFRARLDVIYLDPSLPPQLSDGGVQVTGMKWQGAVFDVNIQLKETTIKLRSKENSGPVTVRIGSNNAKAGDYVLAIGGSLTVPTRRPDLQAPDNKALCKPVTSPKPWVLGRFPLSVVDGSSATYWQPQDDQPSHIIVDLGQEHAQIAGFLINWGQVPAKGFSISIAREREDSVYELAVIESNVTMSAPYDPLTATRVKLSSGNSSEASFGRVHTGRFVRLEIWGTHSHDGSGATVAEFAVY